MPTEFSRRVIMVVTADDLQRANTASHAFTGKPEDAETFTVPLNASGLASDPPSHYWVAAAFTEADYETLVSQIVPAFPDARLDDWDMDAQPDLPNQVLADLGLR